MGYVIFNETDFSCVILRVIFSAKEGEFVYLVRGGEDGEFVKSKEDNQSRTEKR